MAVTTTLNAIDKVNLEDDERLDIPDTKALQELVSEYVVRMLGGLFGGARQSGASSAVTVSGSMNVIDFDFSTLSAVVITNKLLLLNYRQNSIGDDEGQVVWYDPDDPGQQTVINLSSYQAGSDKVYIWAKRFDIPTDADTRRKWVSPAEEVFSLATRQRHRVEFAPNTGDHRVTTGDDQWFIIARAESWSGGLPVIQTWHPFDVGDGLTKGTGGSWAEARNLGFSAADANTLGINQAMNLILKTLSRHRKADGTVHPFTSNPTSGLDDLKALSDGYGDAFDDLAVGVMGVVRIQATGGGGSGNWIVLGSPLNHGALPVSTSSGWEVTVSFVAPFLTIKSAQVSVGGLKDIYAQVKTISGRDVTFTVQTMASLISGGHDWTAQPPDSPPLGTILDIVVLQ